MFKKMERNDECWCGSGLKYKKCHEAFDEKILRYKLKGCKVPNRKMIKNKEQIDGIRESGKINIAVLDYVEQNLHAGMSTEEIDKLVYEKTTELGGIPAPLNFEGYPKSVCTSINDQVCHGIPSEDIFYRTEILSMWIVPRYIRDISQILPECIALEKSVKKRKN